MNIKSEYTICKDDGKYLARRYAVINYHMYEEINKMVKKLKKVKFNDESSKQIVVDIVCEFMVKNNMW